MKIGMKKYVLGLLAAIAVIGCSFETEPIDYGKDICAFCKMTIMDKRFGTELVTSKGKVFKFDDLGCMIKYMKTSELHEADCKHIVMNNFEKPGDFVSFKQAIFVKTSSISSPMLGNVVSFDNETAAQNFAKSDTTSKSLSWIQVNELLK